jgi:hypothetical protein
LQIAGTFDLLSTSQCGGKSNKMRNPFDFFVAQQCRHGKILLDGGLATELENKGKDLSGDALWSARILADDPSSIQQVGLFLEAGFAVLSRMSLLEAKLLQVRAPAFVKTLTHSLSSSNTTKRPVRSSEKQTRKQFSLQEQFSSTLLFENCQFTHRNRPESSSAQSSGVHCTLCRFTSTTTVRVRTWQRHAPTRPQLKDLGRLGLTQSKRKRSCGGA